MADVPLQFLRMAWASFAVGHLGLPVGDSNAAMQVIFNVRETGSSFYMKELFIGLFNVNLVFFFIY